jgi:hypothetical protein
MGPSGEFYGQEWGTANMTTKKISVIMYKYPLEVSLMVINTIILLSNRGYELDLYIDEGSRKSPGKLGSGVNVTIFPDKSYSRVQRLIEKLNRSTERITGMILPVIKCRLNIRTFIALYALLCRYDFLRYIHWLRKKIDRDTNLLIAIDQNALLASVFARPDKASIVYYNLELAEYAYCKSLQTKLQKIIERDCLKTVKQVVIQNNERASAFCRENDIGMEKIKILPVASLGNKLDKKGSYLRDKFKLKKEDWIVIYAGNITAWAMCKEIIQSATSWPSNFVLVMHTWRKNIRNSAYFNEMSRLARDGRVYFSTEPVSHHELLEMFSSADIALMFYNGKGANFDEIAYSSNKLSVYLQAGLPIIASSSPSLKRFFKENKCGMAIDHPKYLPDALNKVAGEYESFRKACFDCYDNNFKFDVHFDRIVSRFFE